ncbi:MAG: hypothetical protein JXA90_14145, partial [Planctomycetes bacterium]|nr:hypothetical protein [Planctomycetota bacterium]
WRIDGIALHPGVNELTILGFDLRGSLVDSVGITVVSTATEWDPPVITDVLPAEGMPGETVEISGAAFYSGAQVLFGGVAAPSAELIAGGPDGGTIIAEIPAGAGSVDLTVRNVDGKTSNAYPFTIIEPPPTFVRGDSNRDSVVDLSDAIRTLLHLFGGAQTTCEDAADADDSGSVEITDAVFTLDFLFRGGAFPPAPFPQAGYDLTSDGLGCEQ